ncbi:hypothetical protein BATDEDRAFT_86168 [Batrachochytrium dendrobatidis JAM81]|uniref:Tyrosinase copper-binding domain-containing protein n=2 Tax=Batrachochytrium dendrobatidis TaxID=109871 RepID=F4NVT9_BATDJ|nr:uncharacterized protein BATDEDRAFT_86168 [Batrachochytrium dendrobatidis JAM81]EGF82710.1 hypothetical protein BATDEDRAFT_86168 [Batrachochytrium dendrobatidis JAM81]OAJ39833.1 hypothetical protein BDEG_23641 [Batrachochytrium dendrobatidis JEL423]|eukprot:XP_006677026.1 hypothetical protein BATDEDRAFT_86168 [Batrachochytrium dendrobatidis JAM81]
MHIFTVILTVIATIAAIVQAAPATTCSTPKVRQEWRKLTQAQHSAFLSAIDKLKNRPASSPVSNSLSGMAQWNYDQFVKTHWDSQAIGHGLPVFLPWHRLFIAGFELALQSIDPSVNLPFWDWSLDSQNPGASDLFSSKNFGGNGQGNDHCVKDGVTKNWKVTYPDASQRPMAPCLTRCFNFTTLYPPEAVTFVIDQSKTYDEFRSNLESGPHGSVHNQVGGTCGDMGGMYSTNDPIFFLHHAMVDRIWSIWQLKCNGAQINTFSEDPSVVMAPFDLSPSAVMSTTAGSPLCYNYGSSASDLPMQLACPNGASTAFPSSTGSVPTGGSSSQSNSHSTASASPATPSTSTNGQQPVVLPSTKEPKAGILDQDPRANSTTGLSTEGKIDVNLAGNWLANLLFELVPNAKHNLLHVETASSNTSESSSTFALSSTSTQSATSTIEPVLDRRSNFDELQPLSFEILKRSANDSQDTYTPNSNNGIQAPNANDFEDMENLRYPPHVPDRWLLMNNLDLENARAFEKLVQKIIDACNNKHGYTSPAALRFFNTYNILGRFIISVHIEIDSSSG